MNNQQQTAVDKLRLLCNWLNWHNEGFIQSFSSISQLESLFDYAQKNNLEFMDEQYIYSECTEEERVKALNFIQKLKSSNK